MKQLLLLLVVIAILSMTMSCSKTQSSSSTATDATDTTTETLDSIDVYRLVYHPTEIIKATGKRDIGNLPAGKDSIYYDELSNRDSIREVHVDRIEFDTLFIKKANTSLDYILPKMIISFEFEVKAQTKPGPFDTDIDIYFKNVKQPLTVPIHGNIQ